MIQREIRAIPEGDCALTFREARARYGIPEHRLRQYRSERALDFFKLGRAVFVSERSLIQQPIPYGGPKSATVPPSVSEGRKS